MNKVSVAVEKLVLPTYPEPAAEEMPMFAENRVHQRSSGRPYPNKVVMEVERSEKIDKEYTVVRLENDYVCIEILPEIGGRVYSAKDKITGYDYFYKQHVIKPALIGVLGSWISGGVEFNWPFHHRASGFMPCDFTVEELEDGSAICWLSEHDPIDRMKGMVGIVLKPDCSYFETRMKLYNRTEIPRSFLWWENAAVPVNEDYRIFFPQDVSYVNFHYLKSRAAYPVAGNTVFNGIPMLEDRDISWHKNTREATSYFASASDFDFFGGYDYGKQCGVVHIGDHHISPGKKMFTWAYGQLSRSWENALTDTDGAYAELMAGSYSDNQPNFSWLAPYETKQFSQYWYPISQIGCPTFANLNFAFSIDRSEDSAVLQVLTTSTMENAQITVRQGKTVVFSEARALSPKAAERFELGEIPEHVTVKITCDGKLIGEYTEQVFDQYHMPDPITDTPAAEDIESVQELYLAGVHVDQYRDPAVLPDAYWLEALRRDPKHIPSLISMARYEYRCFNLEQAKAYIEKAIRLLSVYNERPQSGEAYYVQGLILEAAGEYKKAYDSYRKAAWAADAVSAAMTRVCVLDLRSGDAQKAADHAVTALEYSGNNSLATAVYVIAQRLLGDEQAAACMLEKQLAKDPLDHMARYLAGAENLYDIMDSSASQTCLDLAFDLAAMGQYEDVINLLEKMMESKPEEAVKMVLYTLGYYAKLAGKDSAKYYQAAEKAPMGKTFPFRYEEMVILKNAITQKAVCGTGKAACDAGNGECGIRDEQAGMSNMDSAELLLGDLLYNKLHYSEAAALWEKLPQDAQALRNLAVAYFSHEGRQEEALPLMKKAMELRPDDSQLLYESVVLMDKLAIDPAQKVELLTSIKLTRDDLITELAKAYNQCFQPDKAIETLMSHTFVPCEGGEHAIADQYLFAHLIKGVVAYKEGKTQEALDLFVAGQTLPDNLGAGIWNHCKLIPLKYHQALCMRDLGMKAEANAIFAYIAGTKIEYFSNMHLKELPYYQALSLTALGKKSAATQLITHYMREWEGIAGKKGSGYFGTTPFFISFVDDPQRLRSAQHLYLTALCQNFVGDQDEYEKRIKESARLNNENLFALGAAEGYLFCR